MLVCRVCLRKEGYKEALMQYTDHFYPSLKTYVENINNQQESTDEPPVEKRQKVEETDESKIL